MQKQTLLFFLLFFFNAFLFLFFLITNSYPFFAVLLNIFSIIAILAWVTPFKSLFIIGNKRIIDAILIILLFLLSFCVYLYKIDLVTPGFQGDELVIAKAGEQVLISSNFAPFLPVNYGHPTPLLYLTGISIQLFGKSVMAIRLPYVLFGALTVIAFYFLLRLFFNKNISFATSLLMLFSYPLIVVSRLAYEITPSLFFQILTAIFLYLAWKQKDLKHYVYVGLALGAGIYTYVGFRTFALVALLICAILLYKTKMFWQEKFKYGLVVFITLFIITTPLLSYTVFHFNDIMARTNALSIFRQSLPTQEVIKEIEGNIYRLSHVFFSFGDPNFKNNPSGVSIFDLGTLALFAVGLLVLFKKKKSIILLILIFSLIPIINDIFVYEPIPEAHYYGIGHPNTLRLAGLIPIIYFVIASIAYALEKINLKVFIHSIKRNVIPIGIYITFLPIIFVNWNNYFNQPLTGYVYRVNGAVAMDVVRTINSSGIKIAIVSPQFLQDDRFQYFLKQNTSAKPFRSKTLVDASNEVLSNQMTIVTYDEGLYQLFNTSPEVLSSAGLQMQPLHNPINNSIEALVFIKTRN